MTRKEIIVKAATDLFIEKGYRETTTSDIRKKAGVAQGTLFYHFQNKEGILLHIFGEVIASYLDAIAQFDHKDLTGMEALTKYTEFCNNLRLEKGKNLFFILPNFVPSLLQQHLEVRQTFYKFFNTSVTLLETLIKKGIDDGSIKPVEPHTMAHFIFAIFTGMNRHMTISEKNLPDFSEVSIQFIQDALRP